MTPIARRILLGTLVLLAAFALVPHSCFQRALTMGALPDAHFVGFAQAVNDFGISSGKFALAQLSALQCPEFDAAFANVQVAVQTAAVHQFSAYSKNGTSGPLRRYAKLMLPTSKMFLEYAHRLAASR